jgi:hypothetical protein
VCFLVAKLKKYSEEWTGIQSSRRTDDRLDALNTAVLPQKKKRKNEKNRKTLSIDSAQPAAQEKEHIWNANDLSAQLLMTFIHRLASR